MPLRYEASIENDDSDVDPGREVIENNARARLQRAANYTRDELNKVLHRVDQTLNNYENSVQSSLVQHGMTHQDIANVEIVSDIKELENLLNDSIAKQRYKQRLMVFIVGHAEQVVEKSKLLHQIEQFFIEQKQNFSGKEFIEYDDKADQPDEVDLTLRSFDIKDCYSHVKSLGTRLTELNEEIIQHLIHTAATKQQGKGKKKGAQMSKEVKEQLANLQTKLDAANNDITAKQSRIDDVEGELAALKEEIQKNDEQRKTFEATIQRQENQIESLKKRMAEMEESIEQYQDQIEELQRKKSSSRKASDSKDLIETEAEKNEQQVEEVPVEPTPPEASVPSPIDPKSMTPENDEELQLVLPNSAEPDANLNAIFNPPPGVDLHQVTRENLAFAYANLREYAILRVRELLKELELSDSNPSEASDNLRKEFEDYKIAHEKERQTLIELADNAYKLQMKAQTTAEEAMNHLRIYMAEQEKLKANVNDQETQTDIIEEFQVTPLLHNTPVPENVDESMHEHLSAHSKVISDDMEPPETSRKESLKEKYLNLLEEKQQELEHLKQLAEMVLSRPATSTDEKTTYQDFESLTGLESTTKQDQEQQTSIGNSREPSTVEEKRIDPAQTSFVHLYELLLKFRQALVNILQQNKFHVFADRLQTLKLNSIEDEQKHQLYLDNAESLLKEMMKIMQTSMAVYSSKVNDYETKLKEKSSVLPSTTEASRVDLEQSALIEEKNSIITDLTKKYQKLSDLFNETAKQHDTEINENQRLMLDQQKYIDTLQLEIARLQKRLVKIENDGVVEPSILFTRLDVERNEKTLRKAVDSGKVSETTFDDINDGMKQYVTLPSQQLRNLVHRYVQHRKALDLENRLQTEVDDRRTRSVLQKMEALHERRSAQIRQRMSGVRQYRVDLAKSLTEKFDHLEDENDFFLIRPIYSCQGRAATKSYIENAKRRLESQGSSIDQKHFPSRQSTNPQYPDRSAVPVTFASHQNPVEDDRMFYIDRSFTDPSQSLTASQDPSNTRSNVQHVQEVSRLQEIDYQRTLMPMSHTTTSLLSAFTNTTVDPYVPSLNLRTYVALSRPGAGHVRRARLNEVMTPISRDALSALSVKSQGPNPRTPFNSGAAGRRMSPSLPPIKRQLTPSLATVMDDKSSIDSLPTKTEAVTAT